MTSYVLLNCYNQFSAINAIDALLFALFNTSQLLWFVILFFVLDVDLKKTAEGIGEKFCFSLATYYADTRDYTSKFYKFYGCVAIYALLAGGFIFAVGSVGMNSDLGEGKMSDYMTYGVYTTTT